MFERARQDLADAPAPSIDESRQRKDNSITRKYRRYFETAGTRCRSSESHPHAPSTDTKASWTTAA
jgi:hypothetical protein